jgi:DNA repair exonuclease SbcCD ATPase subunit
MGGHTCEQCNHFTPLGGERLKELEKLPDSHYKPEITLKEWDSRNTSWLKGEKLKETFLAMKAAPPLAEIQEQSKLEEAHKNYASALATYLESKANLESFKFDSEQNQSSLVELHQRGKNLNLQIQTQSELKKAHESYNSYVAAKIKHDAMVVQIQEDTDAYKLEVEVLQELMDAIKSQLLPTINQVGSGMLSLMSEGLHTKLELTEDMQIMVDDEPVDALSGSGKSIAHLSLRLTLAQVLTTGMFPVFMVDEVDGSMSESRSAKVMEALTLMMRKTVKQLIVISHKTIESPDHLIVV